LNSDFFFVSVIRFIEEKISIFLQEKKMLSQEEKNEGKENHY